MNSNASPGISLPATGIARYQPAAMLIARIFLALIFLLSGLSKLAAPDAIRGYMEANHVPGLLFVPTVIFEIGTGLLIALGYRVRIVAGLLAAFCLVTGVLFHNQFADQTQMVMFLKNVAMAGGFLLLASVGAGRFSLDAKRGALDEHRDGRVAGHPVVPRNEERNAQVSNIAEVIKSRVSANRYDTGRTVSEEQIGHLIDLATRAPSAFNLQNWKFVAVRSDAAKARLLPLAYGQQKVAEAAVTFIVCGTLDPHLTLATALKPTLDAGIIDEAVYKGWVGAAQNMYKNNQTFQRDEAIRSGSLAAMTLMLAAQDLGLVSGPMIGFDPHGVAEAFNLEPTDVPVMLVTLGYPAPGNWPQKPRKPVSEVLTFA